VLVRSLQTLLAVTTRQWALGFDALLNNTSGGANTALGAYALQSNTTAGGNTAVGNSALFSNTFGGGNTAMGFRALFNNNVDEVGRTGDGNTATGFLALFGNTIGDGNTANGFQALAFNTTGFNNTAIGFEALFRNTTGLNNMASGASAVVNNTSGGFNTASGHQALENNTVGDGNTATGAGALSSNTTGNHNTAIGDGVLPNNTTGSTNIALGPGAGLGITTADNVVCIGAAGENVSNRCYMRNIRGVTVGNGDGINVLIDSSGQLGTSNSSRRFKKDIRPMDQTSEAVLALKPVMFHYIKQDTKRAEDMPQFGLIAEDVAEVNPDLVVRDVDGEPLAVRYDAVNAMLLNEFLKEHRKVEQLEKQVEALTLGLERVSAQFQLSQSAPRTVLNDQ
jgi:hypothetical protein